MSSPTSLTDFLEFEEGYLSRYIALADTKAMWLFTIFSGVLVYFAAQVDWKAMTEPANSGLVVIAISVTVLFLMGAAALCIDVVRPRTNPKNDTSVIFFGSVADRSSATNYREELNGLSGIDLDEHRAVHCYNLAKVCNRKYRRLKWAIFTGMPGVIAVSIILLLSGAY